MSSIAAVRLYNILIGSMKTQAIYVAAKLGVTEAILDGGKDIETLSIKLETNQDALYRLMRALCSIGLYQCVHGKYEVTEMGLMLRGDVQPSLKPFALLLGGNAWWQAWGNLDQAIQDGVNPFEYSSGEDYFSFLEKNPDEKDLFHNFMDSVTRMDQDVLLEAYDFSAYKKIIDLGGGRGVFVNSILEKNESSVATVIDRKEVIETIDTSVLSASSRIKLQAGNFFENVPSGYDLYILKQVIHDWSDEDACAILANCANVMSNESKLLIVDAILDERNTPSFNKFTDLHMMVLDRGAKERTLTELHKLIEKVGLKVGAVINTGTAFSLVEATL